MFGLIGKIKTHPGKRSALAGVLGRGTRAMPGCISYVIAEDEEDADGLWVTEIWDREENHKASLSLPSVQAAIAEGRPLIAGFETHVRTVPVAGVDRTADA